VALLFLGFLLAPTALAVGPVRGDLDRDESIALTDAVGLLGYIFLGGAPPPCRPVADANGDAVVDVSDPVRLLIFLFGGAPALPPLSAEEEAECAGGNQPPLVASLPVYRTYPGFPIELGIGAQDPENDALHYEAQDLPPGASLDGELGMLRWTPAADQLGPFYVTCAVSDAAIPPNRVTSVLVFQVLPLDPCARPQCEPATGCEPGLAPLGEDCCGDPAATRVDEPDVDCPAGRVLHVGRNSFAAPTIGRLQSCDQLRLVALGQGGHVATLHFEMRCLLPEHVLIEARLQTAGTVLFDVAASRSFTTRADGFIELRNISIVAEGLFSDGMEANLTVAATDLANVRVERQVRVVLTRNLVSDLP
jgi:hypothetical protein